MTRYGVRGWGMGGGAGDGDEELHQTCRWGIPPRLTQWAGQSPSSGPTQKKDSQRGLTQIGHGPDSVSR